MNVSQHEIEYPVPEPSEEKMKAVELMLSSSERTDNLTAYDKLVS